MKGYSAQRVRRTNEAGTAFTNKVRVIVTNKLGQVVYDKLFEDGPASDDYGASLEAVWDCITTLQKSAK